MTTYNISDVAKFLSRDTVVWRPCDDYFHPVDVQFETGKQSHKMCRILPGGYGQFIPEPCVNPYSGSQRKYGIICFVPFDVPDNWTHLVITGCDKQGKALFARPAVIDGNEFRRFRMDVASGYSVESLANDPEKLMRYAALTPITGIGGNRVQVVYDHEARVFHVNH